MFGGSTGSVSDKHVVGTCSKVLVPDIIKETPNDIGNCFRYRLCKVVSLWSDLLNHVMS